jgi:hypothetical protein
MWKTKQQDNSHIFTYFRHSSPISIGVVTMSSSRFSCGVAMVEERIVVLYIYFRLSCLVLVSIVFYIFYFFYQHE